MKREQKNLFQILEEDFTNEERSYIFLNEEDKMQIVGGYEPVNSGFPGCMICMEVNSCNLEKWE